MKDYRRASGISLIILVFGVALMVARLAPTFASGPQWKSACGGKVPQGAVGAGLEADGTKLFVARAKYKKGLHPGKVRPAFGAANIPWGGNEDKVKCYEVFVGQGAWAPASDGNIPEGAIKAGNEENGTPLYIARAYLNGGLHPGKVRPAFKAAHIPWGGREIKVSDYEVLVNADAPPPPPSIWRASCLMLITYSNKDQAIGDINFVGRGASKELAIEDARQNCRRSKMPEGNVSISDCEVEDCDCSSEYLP